MPLIACPDCQRQLSPQAPACPGCGRPMQAPAHRPASWLAARAAAEKQGVHVAYALWAASYVVGVSGIAALILAYLKRSDARGTYLAVHYDWIIETFWQTLGCVIGGVVVVLVTSALSEAIGLVMMIGLTLFVMGWPVYRLIRGWTALNDGRVPEAPATWW